MQFIRVSGRQIGSKIAGLRAGTCVSLLRYRVSQRNLDRLRLGGRSCAGCVKVMQKLDM